MEKGSMELFDITDVEEIEPIRDKEKEILVSIWCLTYNHGAYIREALDSMVSQITDYAYEIVIFDDASTDNTVDIIREYAEKKPELFHVFLAKTNIYKHPCRWEIVNNLKSKFLTGRYVAFCEGDDFWISPHKIQMQVEYMEMNPTCSLTVHDGIRLDCMKNTRTRMIGILEDHNMSADEIILKKRGMLPTASMVIRKEFLILEGFWGQCGVGDWPLQIQAFLKGEVHYFGQCMSCYRYMHEGSWSVEITTSSNKLLFHCAQMNLFLNQLNEYTKYKYEKYILAKKQEFVNILLKKMDDRAIANLQNILMNENSEMLNQYIYQIIEQHKRRTDIKYFPEELKKYVKQYENIWIMGTGHYSEIVSSQFKNNDIQIEGYIVSKGEQKVDVKDNKKVYYIDEMPGNKDNLVVVVAIEPRKWNELQETLENNKIKHYVCSLLV